MEHSGFFESLCARAQEGACEITEVRDGVLNDVIDNRLIPHLMQLAEKGNKNFLNTVTVACEDAIYALALKGVFDTHNHTRFAVFNRIAEHTRGELAAPENVANFMRKFRVIPDTTYTYKVVAA